MANKLITAEQIAEVKDVLKDVTYTFYNADLEYFKWLGSLDRFGENNSNKASYEKHLLKGFIEYGIDQGNKNNSNTDSGEIDETFLTLSFNFKDLIDEGLTEGNVCIVDATKDYFGYEGKLYDILELKYDGYLDNEPILVILALKLRESLS